MKEVFNASHSLEFSENCGIFFINKNGGRWRRAENMRGFK
jgi:hypothetical protein